MSLIVQKFGGSSVATLDKVRRVAARVVADRRRGQRVVVIVSAMGDTTDHLYDLATSIHPSPPSRELDLLLSSGEQVACSLLAMAIEEQGEAAVALTGSQSGIVTSNAHGNAEVLAVRPARILRELSRGRIVVVAGFQGTIEGEGEITTLGRGGSDTTAIAVAAGLRVGECSIFSDVDGVYSADPRVVANARRLDEIGYDAMHALARHGARVLHVGAVELARRHAVEIHIRSSSGGAGRTRVGEVERRRRGAACDVPRIQGVAGRKDLVAITGHSRAVGDAVVGRMIDAAGSTRVILRREVDSDGGGFRLLVGGAAAALVPRLERELPELAARRGLGLVTAVGGDLEGRSAEILRRNVLPSLDSFASPCSVSWLLDAEHVDEGLCRAHRRLVEPRFANTGSGASGDHRLGPGSPQVTAPSGSTPGSVS